MAYCLLAKDSLLIKQSDRSLESARQLPALEDPGTLTHVDFTEDSAHQVLKRYLGDEAEEMSNKPWGIIQVVSWAFFTLLNPKNKS